MSVTDPIPEDLLPSISHLLKRAGALECSHSVDLTAVARQPAFQKEAWQSAIADFLLWSGTTLDPAGGASLWRLLLCHRRPGALALYRAFRDFLIGRGGTAASVRVRLEAVAAVVKMAAHWLHEIDWDLGDAEGIEAQDFVAGEAEHLTVSLSSELSAHLKNALARNPALGPASDFVETAVSERLLAVEQATGRRFPPEQGQNNPIRNGGRGGAPNPGSPPGSPGPTLRSVWLYPSDPSDREPEHSAPPPFTSEPKPPFRGL